jgi:hypothetical protein
MSANNPELIRAHFDGEHEAWLRVVAAQLDTAYNGESDDYSIGSIKEMNPDYLTQ